MTYFVTQIDIPMVFAVYIGLCYNFTNTELNLLELLV